MSELFPSRRDVLALPPEEQQAPRLSALPSSAAGLPAIYHSFDIALRQLGVKRTAEVFLAANQKDGFDCMSCAWPDPDGKRQTFEFCENGAKAFAEEATEARLTADFFREWSVEALSRQTDYWLGHQGRLTEPLWLPPDHSHYQPISWEEAFRRAGDALRSLPSPDEAIFYTSGRASNEAAFLYQLLARMLGTNNLPDCSNMCHESSGQGLNESLGWGRSTVHLDELEHADCILLFGINPATNMPRMLTALERAVGRGARIISINPLPEVGLFRFRHPQEVRGIVGNGVALTSNFLQVKVNGDVALVKGLMKHLLELEERGIKGAVDRDFINQYTQGIEDLIADLRATSWSQIVSQSGVAEAQIRDAAAVLATSRRTVACWAMGLTQHTNGVANIREVVNLMLLQGNFGNNGAGVLCVRGHSNVQGDRSMGIWERPGEAFLQQLGNEFGFAPPRHHGYDVVASIKAMAEGRASVFVGLGGNFLSATPDTLYTAHALQQCRLTVQISTKLNRGHLITGREALILPCLGRTEIDQRGSGPQFVTTENTTCQVRRSQGKLAPASTHLLSEVAIIAGLAQAALPSHEGLDWRALADNYDLVRDHISQVVKGYEGLNQKVRQPGGFVLDMPPRQRVFATPTGKAQFTVNAMTAHTLPEGRYIMMTVRSHDQFNTTIYGWDDRYRGIHGGRRIVLMNEADMRQAQLSANMLVDLTSHFQGQQRQAQRFRVVPYDIPRGYTATYFPESNVLVPIDSFAEGSHTPTSKFVEISVRPSEPVP